jgi:aquaporin Z
MMSAHADRIESTQEQLMLHGSAPPDFLESAHEWRRLFAEAWGTFLLVVVAAGAGAVGAQSGGVITLSMKVVAPGLMVMAIIYFMGAVGGGSFKPSGHVRLRGASQFPMEPGAGLYRSAVEA